MKVFYLNEPLIFHCIPSIYPDISDDLTLILKNELTKEEITPEITFEIREYLNVTIESQPTDFALQNKYELTVLNGSDIIYMGKAVVLKNDTNVQNYEYKSQQNEYFRYKQ